MGGKKKGGGHTPYEAPDNLKSHQRLRAIGLISMGPIRGPVDKDQFKNTFFNNTAIQNPSGDFNFNNTEIQYNLGYQDQLPLEGFEFTEREVPVGAEVKKDSPITRTVIDNDVTRLRLTIAVNALFSQNDMGDTYGASVAFQVLINDVNYKIYQIDGKASSRFFRSYIIENLPPRPFTITVKRLTDDSKSQRLQNGTVWSSFTEIIDTKLSYPNMAMLGVKLDSRYHSSMPDVTSLLDGRIIKIPTTYDPDKRTYETGIWRGDFKTGWTNNPAWIFYDIVTNRLVNSNDRLSNYGVDKFQLYQIAKYCDQLVPDGYGGQEPRIVSNLWMVVRRSAFDVLSDMASTFRAIVAWNGIQLALMQDRPTDPVFTFTQSNVIEGKFNRQYVPLKSIFSAVEVEYANERNMYQRAIEYVADDDMIRRFGYNVKKLTAYGCTSRGQARRYGKWVLETSKLEQCTISFGVGRDGLAVLPGDIIEVVDNAYSGFSAGGRVISFSDNKVTLDREIDLSLATGKSYLSYINSDNKEVKLEISSVDPSNSAVVILKQAPEDIPELTIWALRSSVVKSELYRVLGVSENEDGSFAITALQHEPQKHAIVDNGAIFEPINTTTRTTGLIPPTNADVSTDSNGINLSFNPPAFIGQGLKYQVKLFRDGKIYHVFDDLKEPNIAFTGLPDGDYVAEIRAKNANGQLSEPLTKTFNIRFTITELTAVAKMFGILLQWKNPLYANNNSAIEIWTSTENKFDTARKLVSLAYPTNSYSLNGLGINETHYFWARLVDTTNGSAGQFTEVVAGTSESSGSKLVQYLQGQVTKDAFTRELAEEIALIGEKAESAGNKVSVISDTVDGLKAKYTIKVESHSSGKKAIAGIALGADAQNEQSVVVISADKLVIADPNSDSLKTPFVILNEDQGSKIALDGDLIASGSITGDKIQANTSISAPNIAGGTIEGNEINGSTIKGSTIEGGVIRGARIEGVTGKFEAELEVTKLVGGNIFDFGRFNAKYIREERRWKSAHGQSVSEIYKLYRTTIFIPKTKVKRMFRLTQDPIGYNRSYKIYGSGSNPDPQTITFPAHEGETYSISPDAQQNGVGVWVLEPNLDYTATCEVWCAGGETGSVAKFECFLFDQSTLITQL